MKFHQIYSLLLFFIFLACKQDAPVQKQPLSKHKIVETSFDRLTIDASDDVILHYTKFGEQSKVLLFVHGWSCDQTYWKEQIDFFKDDYQLITVDLAGHGNSTLGSRSYWTILSLTQDLLEVINTLEFEQLVLVGHSMGAMVVMEAATQLERSDVSIVAVDYLKQKLEPLSEETLNIFIEALESDFENSTKDFAMRMFRATTTDDLKYPIIKDMASAPPAVAIPLFVDLVERDYSTAFSLLEEKKIDRFIINSDMAPTDEAFYSNLGFQIVTIPQTSHFVMMEKPFLFNKELQKCLK